MKYIRMNNKAVSVLAGTMLTIMGLTACGQTSEEMYLEARALQESVAAGKASQEEALVAFEKAGKAGSVDAAAFLARYYYEHQDYVQAFQWAAVLKEANKSEFTYLHGVIKLNGYGGVPQNTEEGLQLLEQAIKLKNSRAAFEIAKYYEQQHNLLKALEFYNVAKTFADARANIPFARLIIEDHISDIDAEKAFSIVKSIVNDKNVANKTDATLLLARCYYEGFGVERNQKEAVKLLSHYNKPSAPIEAQFLYSKFMLTSEDEAQRKTAVDALHRMAVEDHFGKAAMELYHNYIKGSQAVKKSSTKAIFYARLAQQLEMPEAYLALADMYLEGIGTERNEQEAFNLVTKAYEINPYSVEAMCTLGSYYSYGIGVTVDDNKANELIKKAADLGSSKALLLKAKLLNEGRMIAESDDEAMQIFRRFAEQGDATAAYEYGMILYHAAELSHDYSPAIKYLRQALDGGVESARFHLAKAYDFNGDIDNAIAEYKILAEGDSHYKSEASACLGEIYQEQNNYEESVKYYTIASKLGHEYATINLGRAYFVAKDYASARAVLEPIANVNGLADTYIAMMYEQGTGYEQSDIRALDWYDKAINKGNIDALYLKGILLVTGKQVPDHQRAQAEEVLSKAACRGHEIAAVFLATTYLPHKKRDLDAIGWLQYALSLNPQNNTRSLLEKDKHSEEERARAYANVKDTCRNLTQPATSN